MRSGEEEGIIASNNVTHTHPKSLESGGMRHVHYTLQQVVLDRYSSPSAVQVMLALIHLKPKAQLPPLRVAEGAQASWGCNGEDRWQISGKALVLTSPLYMRQSLTRSSNGCVPIKRTEGGRWTWFQSPVFSQSLSFEQRGVICCVANRTPSLALPRRYFPPAAAAAAAVAASAWPGASRLSTGTGREDGTAGQQVRVVT